MDLLDLLTHRMDSHYGRWQVPIEEQLPQYMLILITYSQVDKTEQLEFGNAELANFSFSLMINQRILSVFSLIYKRLTLFILAQTTELLVPMT